MVPSLNLFLFASGETILQTFDEKQNKNNSIRHGSLFNIYVYNDIQ